MSKFDANSYDYVFHKQNEIIATIQSTLKFMLYQSPYADWNVAQSNQPTIQALENNTIYFDVISKRRYGVQAEKDILDNTTKVWKTATVWLEEWLIEISGFKQRNPESDNALTTTAVDVVTYLQACVNGGGPKAYINDNPLRQWWPKWINIIRSTDLHERDYETDSGLKEKYPSFEFLMVIPQSLLKTNAEIDKIDLELKRI